MRKTDRLYCVLDRVICELFFGDPLILSSVQPRQSNACMYLLISVCKPFESLVVFKELSEGAEEDAKLFELEIVVPVLPLTLNILSRMKRICNQG